MAITKPTLPPKKGYIEVEENGIRVYKPLQETIEKESAQERILTLEEELAATDEAAIQLYEASLAQEEINAEQDEAIIELYEAINNG